MLTTKIIGSRIVAARKNKNLSQAQLAEQLFISAQAVGKWERGESMPDMITFNRLADILHVDLNYFSENFAADDAIGLSPVSAVVPTLPKKRQWDMSGGNWSDADFSGLNNLEKKLSSSNFRNCEFQASVLSGLLLKGNNVEHCDFSGANLCHAQIEHSSLAKSSFRDSVLNNATVTGSEISRCDFSGANLSHVTFKSGGFSRNIAANAIWLHTSFLATQLTDVVFETDLEHCIFEHCGFKRIVFQKINIHQTFFKNNSLKGLTFVDCTADRMSYEFLKNGKVNLSGLSIAPEGNSKLSTAVTKH